MNLSHGRRGLGVMAALGVVALLMSPVAAVAAVPPAEATHLWDLDASPTNSLVMNGITVSWAEGGAGGGGIDAAATGSESSGDPSSTVIAPTNRRTIDDNNPTLRSYIWARVSFSQPIDVGDAFGMGDIDGSDANWELGGIVGYNDGSVVRPSYQTGSQVELAAARTPTSSPPGYPLPNPVSMVRASGNASNLATDDPRGRVVADFGTRLVTDIVFLYAIGPQVPSAGTQQSVLYDIGLENIPALAPPIPAPAIHLVKTLASNSDPDDSGTVSRGDILTYRFDVSNTGNVTLDPITVTDPLPGLGAISCPLASLAAGEETSCTATYTVAQADVDVGSIANTATATGASPGGGTVTDTSTVTVPVPQNPAIQIDKSPASGTGPFRSGQRIDYTFTITNTGNVTLDGVSFSDPTLAISDRTCGVDRLGPAQSTTCTASTVATSAQLDAGQLVNTATATGRPPHGAAVTDSDDALVVLQQSPAITLAKTVSLTGDADGSGTANDGDTLTYTFTITNTGDVTLGSIALTDARLGLSGATCGTGALAPAASTTCRRSYTVTTADTQTGSVDNTATVSGSSPVGLTVTSTDHATMPTFPVPAPGISLTKLRTGGPTPWTVGDVLQYSFSVANTGNVPLTGVNVTDPRTGPVTCPGTTLAADASMTCTASYTVTQSDADAGRIVNTAAATGTPPSGPAVRDTATHTESTERLPGITVDKRVTGDVILGATLSYRFVVTNTGNVTLDDVTLVDTLPGLSAITCAGDSLAPRGALDCSASYVVTQADVDAGSVRNTVTATGTPPDGLAAPAATDTTVADAPTAAPVIRLDKSVALTGDADGDGVVSAGDALTYTFVVTNTGDVTLHDVSIDDARLGLSGLVCAATPTLAPAASVTCTARYAVTGADVADGSIVNTATARGTPPSGAPAASTAGATVLLPQAPGIGLTKTVAGRSDLDGSGGDSAGDSIAYSFVVKNTGDVPLRAVAIHDPAVANVACTQSTLDVGASMTCTATHVLAQREVDAGRVDNTATVSGTPPGGIPPVQDSSTATAALTPRPSLTLAKTHAALPDVPHVGGPVTFRLHVTNTGNVTLTDVAVTDPLAAPSCPQSALAPGAAMTCTATYTLTQADIDAGDISNTAETTGNPPAGGTPPTGTGTDDVPLPQTPGISFDKSHTDIAQPARPGEVVDYRFRVANTGNVTLTQVAVLDPNIADVSCPRATLAPGSAMTCTASYTLTATDVDTGSVHNTASATGSPPGDGAPPIAEDTDVLDLPAVPAISIHKSHMPLEGTAMPGDLVHFRFAVTNTGNVTLSNVAVSDPLTGAVACPESTLALGETMTCTASYTLTPGDIDAGSVANTATATGRPPSGGTVTDDDTDVVHLVQHSGISVDKTHGDVPATIAAGGTVDFSFRITNTGNVTLGDVVFTDRMLGITGENCGEVATLAAGTSTTCTVAYTLTQADVDALGVTNTVTVTGDPPAGGTPVTGTDSDVVHVPPIVAISIAKSHAALPGPVRAGDAVHFSFAVTNTGDATLADVAVDDPMVGSVACPDTTLSPGQTMTCTGGYPLTQTDIDSGSIRNTATVTGTPPAGLNPPTSRDTDVVTLPPAPGISMVKTHGGIREPAMPGDTVHFHFAATNTGNVTLAGVRVDDPMVRTVACPGARLAPQARVECTAAYILTQADLDAGVLQNSATVTADPPGGATPPTGAAHDRVPLAADPAIEIDKAHESPTGAAAGDHVEFTFRITNTGNVTLTDVAFTDPLLAIADARCGRIAELASGASTACTATYTLTAADAARRSVLNTATATGRAPTGDSVRGGDEDRVPLMLVATPPPSAGTSTTPGPPGTPGSPAMPPPSNAPVLPVTGGTPPYGTLVLAALLLATGGLLMAGRRRGSRGRAGR